MLRKARDELAHHHTQLVQVSHKYEKSIFKNAKLEDSFSATRRELEEFKRKDVENAKAIKQVLFSCLQLSLKFLLHRLMTQGQFMAREYKRVQRELQEKVTNFHMSCTPVLTLNDRMMPRLQLKMSSTGD